MKLECRWCNKTYSVQWMAASDHEPCCLLGKQKQIYDELTFMAKSYNEHQLAWSIEQAKRWRALPGKGWHYLDTVPMLEYIGRVTKEKNNG